MIYSNQSEMWVLHFALFESYNTDFTLKYYKMLNIAVFELFIASKPRQIWGMNKTIVTVIEISLHIKWSQNIPRSCLITCTCICLNFLCQNGKYTLYIIMQVQSLFENIW